MNCKKVNELLIRYLEGDLKEQEKSLVERHLQECKKCLDELALLKEVLKMAKLEKIPSLPEDYWAGYSARLWQKLRSMAQHEIGSEWVRSLRWAVPVFALALFLFIYFSRTVPERESPAPFSPAKAPVSVVQTTPVSKGSIQAKSLPPATVKKSVSVSQHCTLLSLADSMDQFYNPVLDTTEVIDRLYAQAVDIENALKETEEKDYLNLIDDLTYKERQELIKKIKALL